MAEAAAFFSSFEDSNGVGVGDVERAPDLCVDGNEISAEELCRVTAELADRHGVCPVGNDKEVSDCCGDASRDACASNVIHRPFQRLFDGNVLKLRLGEMGRGQ